MKFAGRCLAVIMLCGARTVLVLTVVRVLNKLYGAIFCRSTNDATKDS